MWKQMVTGAALMMICAGCSTETKETQGMNVDSTLRSDLLAIQEARIFFGHQSVGENIMEGVRELARDVKDSGLRFGTPDRIPAPPGGAFLDAAIGENARPETKCRAFDHVLANSLAARIDIALMKFCYVDITAQTDVEAMFGLYCATIDSLRAQYPQVRFVHVTAPLTRRTAPWKQAMRGLLGRTDLPSQENLRREQFNRRMRGHFAGEPIFDLAAVESTYPNGLRESVEDGGMNVYSLIPEYTDDGGHLNETGRRIAARELLRVLAVVAGGIRR